MRVGAHISSAGGVEHAPKNGQKIGCEIIQFFSRPPQGGTPKPITEESASVFLDAMQEQNIQAAYIHAPYFINLASAEDRIRSRSISILREELQRGTALSCRAMMFHPGSAKDVGQAQGEALVIDGLNRLLNGYTGTCKLLIEISAGAGMVMGDTFEEIAHFIQGAERGNEIGVCFDTQHAFASGYDLRTKQRLDEMLSLFDAQIGLNRIIVSHVNDSKVELGSHKDRHEHLGEGFLGLKSLEHFVRHPKLSHLDLILETPLDEKRAEEINLLHQWSQGAS